MHPVLFSFGSFTLHTYGAFVALGAGLSFIYLYRQGKQQYGIPYNQSNHLFTIMIISAIVGGKLFMIFENPSYYLSTPSQLFSRSGFVFYGAFLTTIPFMLWYFKKMNAPALGMLDIIAGVACIVHGVGRIGCFFAGCCHGTPTDLFLGVVFTDPSCSARPLNTALHPTQLYEAGYISLVFVALLLIQRRKQFNGQIFLIYLVLYAIGRSVIELFRGDEERGFVYGSISISQFIAILIILISLYFYVRLYRQTKSTQRQ